MLIAATSGDKPVFIKIPGIAQTFDKIKGEETEFVPYPTFNTRINYKKS